MKNEIIMLEFSVTRKELERWKMLNKFWVENVNSDDPKKTNECLWVTRSQMRLAWELIMQTMNEATK